MIASCYHTGGVYDPKASKTGTKLGRLAKIDLTGPEAQLIADVTETGMSITDTVRLLYFHADENGETRFTRSAVNTAINAIQPQKVTVSKRKQGHTAKNCHWSKSRLAWVTQVPIHYRKMKSQSDSNGVIQDCYNSEKLTLLVPQQGGHRQRR